MTSLWDWAVKVYTGGVPDICLDLQDNHAQNVPLLLWAAWRSQTGRLDDSLIPEAIAAAHRWEEVILPLRAARRRLKIMDHESLRTQVKAVELQAEKALLDHLAGLATDSAAMPSLPVDIRPAVTLDAVLAVAGAWSPDFPAEKLARLTQALSEG